MEQKNCGKLALLNNECLFYRGTGYNLIQAENEMPIEVLLNADKAGSGSVDNRTIVASDSNNETGPLSLPKPCY
jgi:hypothetical protein